MEPIEVRSAKELRAWFKKYHKTESKITILLHKRHTGKGAPTHREQIEEAICFGWIDTTLKRLDEDRFMRNFSKRTAASKWSSNTLSYAKRLAKEGKMTPQGLHFYTLGMAKPTHDHGIPKDPSLPPELKAALSKNKKAKAFFETMAPSKKRMLYRWFLRAKLPETKQKRAAQIVEQAYASSNNKR